MALVVKNPPARAGDIRDMGSIPGSERSPGRGHGNPPCLLLLENPMDKGAWWATVHMVDKSQTGLKQLCMHTRTHRKLKNLSLKIKISIIFPVLCVLCYMQSIFHIPFDLIFGILTGDVLSLKSHKWRPRKVTILPKVTWLMSK